MSLDGDLDLLLVEDNANDAELALRAIAKGMPAAKVRHVEDGVLALDFLLARHSFLDRTGRAIPRLVLLDLKLPKLNGLEVLREIRQQASLASVPVVMFSSSREERDLAEAYAIGCNGYVVKPVNFDAFVSVMAQVASYWLGINQTPSR